VITKFARSHESTKKLHDLCGKKLLFPANTRWNTLAITYNRVIELYEHINTIAIRKGWPHIQKADYEVILFYNILDYS
jgi:hypothetical protein